MPKKKIDLPPEEVSILSTLSGQQLRSRVRDLYDAGWPLSSIGEALTPPKPRSTIHLWVKQSSPSSLPIPSSPPSSDSSTLGTPENSLLDTQSDQHQRRRRRRLYTEPTISPQDLATIRRLSPLARRYRSKANPSGQYAIANQDLTILCRSLYKSGTSIRELAEAAEVTYKAMERRVLNT